MSVISQEIQHAEEKFAAIFDVKHIVLALSLAITMFVGVYLWQDRRIAVADGKRAVAEAVAKKSEDDAKAAAQANSALQAQKDQIIATFQAANASLKDANDKLAAANKAANDALNTQVSKDKQLPPTELAIRWQVLVPAAKVQATPSGDYTVNSDGGLATILELERVPVLTNEVDNLTTQLQNDQATIANDTSILSAEKDKHKSDVENDGKQLTASQNETKKVQADFDDYKQKSKRRVMRAFVAGFVAGVVVKVAKIF